MALHSPEEHVVAEPDAYDLLNNVEARNYDHNYYIEKEGLHINYVLEDEEDDFVEEEIEDVAPPVEANKDLPSSSNAPVTFSGTFDGLVQSPFLNLYIALESLLKDWLVLALLKVGLIPLINPQLL